MNSRHLIIVILIGALVGSSAHAQEVRYFAAIDDSMTGGFVGIDPVTKHDLERRKGYEFHYTGPVVTKIIFVDPCHQYGADSSFFGCRSVEYHWTGTRAVEVQYRDDDGNLTKNDSGVFIEDDVVDDNHRVVQATNRNNEHQVMLDSYGVCSYTYEYRGQERTSRRFDSSGTQISDTSKVFLRKIRFNDQGLLETSISYDVHGTPVVNDDGVSGERDSYDDRNNLVQAEYFRDDGTGRFVDAADRSGIHRTQYTVDAFGNTLRTQTYSLTGDRVADPDGVFETLTSYDPDGYVLVQQTKGVDGRLCDVKGVAEVQYQYDRFKNNVNEKRRSRDGRVTVEYRRQFDAQNRLVVGASFDQDGRPLDQQDEDGDFSYCLVVFAYRDNGDVEARYYNAAGVEVGPDPGTPDDQARKI